LGVKPIAGRFLEASDDDPGVELVTVLSQHAWATLFGSDSSVIGKGININGMLATIIGVAPRSLQLRRGTFPDFSLPMAFAGSVSQGSLVRPGLWWLELMARRKAGATLDQVQASLQGIFEGTFTSQADSAQAIAREHIPQLIAVPGSRGFMEIYMGDSEGFLLTVSMVFALLLLIVCLNLANLLTARGASREYEIAMRLALGASRLRLIRQLLTESVILALMGGVAGIVLSLWGKEVLRAYFGPQVLLTLSWRILAFNIAVASLTGLLFGLAPALRATRWSLSDTAKQKAGNPTQSKRLLNKSLIVVQVAMSVVLLIGAGLLIQSAGNWSRLDMGLDPTKTLLFEAPPSEESRKGADIYSLIADQIRGIPGVLGVSTAGCFPPNSCGNAVRSIGGDRLYRADARYMVVNPGFFNAAGVPLVAGRTFTAAEATEDSAVAVIDEEFARLLFPGSSPLGKRFIHETNGGEHEVEVIGVARNIVLDVGRERLRPVLYGPEPTGYRYGTTFIVRIAGDSERIGPLIRRAVSDIDPRFPIFGMTTFKQLAERNLSQHRQLSTTWTFFGGSVLLLTAIGLYGLMAYTVSRRVNEIGIRFALGATRLNVVTLVMNQILRLIFIGLGVGFVMSLGLNQVIRAYVFGIQLFDLRTLIAVASLVAVVTLAAGFLPAQRSARIDPVIALRSE
jgi:predicted permease